MSDHAFFLRRIEEDPTNDLNRLVYADWLEEQGDPRADLIRLECQLNAVPTHDVERLALEKMLEAKTRDYDGAWARFVTQPRSVAWRREPPSWWRSRASYLLSNIVWTAVFAGLLLFLGPVVLLLNPLGLLLAAVGTAVTLALSWWAGLSPTATVWLWAVLGGTVPCVIVFGRTAATVWRDARSLELPPLDAGLAAAVAGMLRGEITVEEAEIIFRDEDLTWLGPRRMPFGTRHLDWRVLRANYRTGDQVREFRSGDDAEVKAAGLALIRDGQIVFVIHDHRRQIRPFPTNSGAGAVPASADQPTVT